MKKAVLQDPKIDLILTDYCMPGVNGYDLLKVIKVRIFKSGSYIIMLLTTQSLSSSSLFLYLKSQDHTSLKAIPVVIMSSENKPQRISR